MCASEGCLLSHASCLREHLSHLPAWFMPVWLPVCPPVCLGLCLSVHHTTTENSLPTVAMEASSMYRCAATCRPAAAVERIIRPLMAKIKAELPGETGRKGCEGLCMLRIWCSGRGAADPPTYQQPSFVSHASPVTLTDPSSSPAPSLALNTPPPSPPLPSPPHNRAWHAKPEPQP